VDQSTVMVVPAFERSPRSSPKGLSEHFALLKFNVVSNDVVASPGQLMGQSIMSNTGIGLVQFPVIEIAARLMGLPGMIGRLRESP